MPLSAGVAARPRVEPLPAKCSSECPGAGTSCGRGFRPPSRQGRFLHRDRRNAAVLTRQADCASGGGRHLPRPPHELGSRVASAPSKGRRGFSRRKPGLGSGTTSWGCAWPCRRHGARFRCGSSRTWRAMTSQFCLAPGDATVIRRDLQPTWAPPSGDRAGIGLPGSGLGRPERRVRPLPLPPSGPWLHSEGQRASAQLTGLLLGPLTLLGGLLGGPGRWEAENCFLERVGPRGRLGVSR